MASVPIMIIKIEDFTPTKLFIWTLWQLVSDMRVGADPFAERLETALDRYVNTFGPDTSESDEGKTE